MEKINFIPANELPVAEGDEVSVLCLENGEMKQKPANGLGGSIEFIKLNTDDYNDVTVPDGMYNQIVNAINSAVGFPFFAFYFCQPQYASAQWLYPTWFEIDTETEEITVGTTEYLWNVIFRKDGTGELVYTD